MSVILTRATPNVCPSTTAGVLAAKEGKGMGQTKVWAPLALLGEERKAVCFHVEQAHAPQVRPRAEGPIWPTAR